MNVCTDPVYRFSPAPCPVGTVLPLVFAPQGCADGKGFHRTTQPLPDCGTLWRAGTQLFDAHKVARFQVVGRMLMPTGVCSTAPHAQLCPLLKALTPLTPDTTETAFSATRTGWALAWITLSDKGAAGLREDESGPLMASETRSHLPLCHEQGFMIPDDPHMLRALVMELTLGQGYDLVLTSGGTGLAERDTTPEALLPLFERRLHGFEQGMMQASLAKTPTAMLSRAVAGTIGHSLVLTLPGSCKAVRENLAAVLPALGHALDKIHGDPTDCGH
ncbi:MAG: MogA/MoaB family molybdenum cofactor biosynthesis protein [Bilophila sp.]